jgi:4-hydroxy-tetrahydrodipicolinate reductase
VKIAIIGYGKMGKEIEQAAIERGHIISQTFSSEHPFGPNSQLEADVAIEFSKPELAVKHMEHCLSYGVPVVVGTTGWGDQLPAIESQVKKHQGSLLHASNFSLGVHLFWNLSQKLSQLMNGRNDYNASITEIHHTEKLDQPSGTAITTAEIILKEQDDYNGWELTEDDRLKEHVLPVTSQRIPYVPGTHEIKYESAVDQLSLTHEAKTRKGFALGAVIAAEWLKDKKGTYTMSDILNFT